LAVKSPTPPMIGALKLKTKFILPPGHEDVVRKLRLDGRFAILGARFTSFDVQSKIDELSHRSRGKDRDERTERVASDFAGTFRLAAGVVTIPQVRFAVLGLKVRLAGQYDLRSERLELTRALLTDATVSDT